jgi:DNA-binding MarR family transcriptional regulator
MFMSMNNTDLEFPDIQVCACANLRRATRMVTQAYDAVLRPVGLRATQFTMLSVLAKGGRIRQSKLAETLGMDGTTLTRNLQPLLKNEWIEIGRDDDQRVRLISITDQGRRVLDQAIPLWRQAQSKFVNGLGKDDLSTMLGALARTVDIAQGG